MSETHIAVDPGELRAALTSLARAVDRFDPDAHRPSAPVPAGTGPVGHVLGHAFDHRLSTSGGIGYVTRTQHRMLRDVVAGLTSTTRRYVDTEECLAAWLTSMAADRAGDSAAAPPSDARR